MRFSTVWITKDDQLGAFRLRVHRVVSVLRTQTPALDTQIKEGLLPPGKHRHWWYAVKGKKTSLKEDSSWLVGKSPDDDKEGVWSVNVKCPLPLGPSYCCCCDPACLHKTEHFRRTAGEFRPPGATFYLICQIHLVLIVPAAPSNHFQLTAVADMQQQELSGW